MRDNVYPTHNSNRRTGQAIFEAITRLVYNAVGIYASRHARYNEVDLYLYCFIVCNENVKICLNHRRLAKTLTFSNISVITVDIYLKVRVVVQY